MKRLSALLLLIVFILSTLVGCSGITDGPKPGNRPDINLPTGDTTTPGGDDGTVNPDEPFTVTIIYDEKIFTKTTGIQAEWTSTKGDSVYRAPFAETTRTASISGLNGAYMVTLVGLPDTYRYNYNSKEHIASNNNRHITIEIFEHITPKGSGAGLYAPDIIETVRIGAYTSTIKKKNGAVYYQFTPTRSGVYFIETICNTNEDNINPSIDVYNGHTAYKVYSHSIDSGGSESDYTRNAVYKIQVDPTNLGGTYPFAIKATEKGGNYPCEVEFIIRFAGEYEREKYKFLTLYDENDNTLDTTKYTVYLTENIPTALLYEGVNYTLTRTSAGEGSVTAGVYTATGKNDEMMTLLIESVDDQNGSVSLTIDDVEVLTAKYRIFDRLVITPDYDALAEYGLVTDDRVPKAKLRYPDLNVSPGIRRFEDSYFVLGDDGFYHVGSPTGPILYAKLTHRTRFFLDYYPPGDPEGMEVSFQFMGPQDPLIALNKGEENYRPFADTYISYVSNEEGVYPVNEELKTMLQKFAIAQSYFADGNGWAETHAEDALGYKIYSAEDDMWLFACCYYSDVDLING